MVDIQNKIRQRQSQADSDAMDLIFLDRLHVAIQRAQVKVTDWEQNFVADLVREHRPLTDPQRKVIAELKQRHQGRIDSPGASR